MKLRSLKLITAISLASLLVGCTDNTNKTAESIQATDAEHENHNTDANTNNKNTLPLPKRLAFMSGHVEAGLALYRASAPEMAAKHLLHPVSETHAAERIGLDALGFNAVLFEEVSRALDAGKPASEIEPQLQDAEANIQHVTEKAGGDPNDIILFLMDTILEEYAIGVQGGTVTDPGEYQDAFGFATVARRHALILDDTKSGPTLAPLIDALLATWPEAPLPPENPTPLSEIEQHVSVIQRALLAH